VSLSTELEHCKAYVAIEMARFEDRVSISFDIDRAVLDCKIPPLILQPLVENALKHGILPREEGGSVTINAHQEDGLVRISVHDNGVGMTTEQVQTLFSEKPKGTGGNGAGIALRNVKMRLATLYGDDHTLTVESSPRHGTTVSFAIPM
jgi:two-component system sensor histidine kinase LytS